jgi:hypothetical protein
LITPLLINKMSLNRRTTDFLNAHFDGLRLRAPLFFNGRNGLRFDLQHGETDTESYFKEVVRRATQLFEATFEEDDRTILYLIDYRFKKRKIRFLNYCFKQICGLVESDVAYSTVKGLYEPEGQLDLRNTAQVEVTRDRINYRNIFTAIANRDFSRLPGLDQYGFLGSKEVFLINLDKKVIFHMYDDRGLDIVAAEIDSLRTVYNKYNHWILESNKDDIDAKFAINRSEIE